MKDKKREYVELNVAEGIKLSVEQMRDADRVVVGGRVVKDRNGSIDRPQEAAE